MPVVRGAAVGQAVGFGSCTTRLLGRVTLVRWLVRIGRCREPACPTGTFRKPTTRRRRGWR